MTQDEIIEMARESGLETQDGFSESVFYFAKLATEREREACWQIACDYTQRFNSHTCLAVADAIRARGQA